MSTLQPYLDGAFSRLHLLVIGEAMLDTYLKGTTERLCREAPVPVVTLQDQEYVPGGAANAAANIRALGAEVSFLSVIGDDHEGSLLQRAMEERGVAQAHVFRHPSRRTLAKQRVMSGSQVMLRFDQGSTENLDEQTENRLIERLHALYADCDALLISHYGYGILTPRIIKAIKELQQRTPRLLAVDAKHLEVYRELGATLMKPNYEEITSLLGIPRLGAPQNRADQILRYEKEIMELSGAQIVAVTLDTDGAVVFERGSPPYRTYARPSPHSRAAGAGDTFISTLTLAMAAGAQTHTAAELASAASGVVVGKEGTSACSLNELRTYISATEAYLPDLEQLAARIQFCRQQGQRIVFTNGCFDILHRGHINYLNRAKGLGDVLILGLNSDASIRRLKGSSRPINSLEDRAQVMAALSCIDYIIPFDEDTPARLIETLRPDIFVKGGDYTRETLPEASIVEAYGGQVEILPYLQDFSTTNMIERIREVYARAPAPKPPLGGAAANLPAGGV